MKKIISVCLSFLLLMSAIPVSAGVADNVSFEEELAGDLKNLGLFQGVSDTDFALDRAPTRVEALVMLIRLLGDDAQAQNSTYSHPFTDVPRWADGYVGYAYQKGLTKGVSETTFGTGEASAQMYLTFVLRALGYSDTNGEDFSWSDPYSLAESVGILPGQVDRVNFLRGDVVLVSYAALNSNLNDTNKSLAQKLIEDGVFTYEQYTEYYDPAAFAKVEQNSKELSSEEIYDRCSPAVFYIEMYDRAGNAISSGSGFFLEESGIAVTNYHVIEDGYSAKVTISGTEEVYDVVGVYDYSEKYDWAVIQIDGSGFSTLEIGNEDTVIGGSAVYAIGSPLGLKNTISQGLISNTHRWVDNVCYIQTSAAISSGSSGGALINKYGEVIGITSAGFTEGQNLNLALPMSVIAEHQRNTLTPLSTLAEESSKVVAPSTSGDSYTAKENAYYTLLAVIETMANEDINGLPAYTERIDTENGYVECSICRNEDYTIDVIYFEVYRDDLYYTSLTLDLASNDYFVFYSYNLEDDPLYFMGMTEIYAPNYTSDSKIHFLRAEGNADQKLNEEICHDNLMAGLDFVQSIFARLSELGNYSIADLGFINY